MNKIKDIDEFCRLYKINIPINEEFDYYISTLLKSPEYNFEDLEKKINDFAQLEKYAETNNFSSVSKLKMYCLDTLVEYIKATNAYVTLQEKELPKKQLNTKDWTSTVLDSDMLMSIDFKSANYSVLKTFDNSNELKGSWRKLCESLLIPEALIESKSFRQIVFGNCSPKKLQTFQHGHIMTITEELKNSGIVLDNNLVFVSHDEFIVKICSISDDDVEEKMLNLKKHTEKIILDNNINMPIHSKIFALKKIGKNKYIKHNFDLSKGFVADFSRFEFPVPEFLSNGYKSLIGVPGNKFYMYFKKHILNEPIEKRDLYFMNDGELASWVISDIPK